MDPSFSKIQNKEKPTSRFVLKAFLCEKFIRVRTLQQSFD